MKSEERLKTLQLLESLAPDASTSAGLLSSSTLGQNPFAPTSAKARFEKKEDRAVRKEMSRLRRRGLRSSDESGDDDSAEEKGAPRLDKGKSKATESEESEYEIHSKKVGSEVPTKVKSKSRKSKAVSS